MARRKQQRSLYPRTLASTETRTPPRAQTQTQSQPETRIGRKTARDPAEFVHCTLDDILAEDAVCRTAPARAVRILRRELVRASASHAEVGRETRRWAAMSVAVGELVKGAPPAPRDLAAWRRLVEAGVVEALVDEVVEGTQMFLEPLVGVSKEFQERALNLMWKEPFNSLREEEAHLFSRFHAATLFSKIVAVDPSFLEFACHDFTIPLITRNWVYAGSCAANQVDAYMIGAALNALFQRPHYPKIQQYVAARPDALSREQLFKQMCVGAGTTPYGAKRDPVKALVDAFGTRFASLNGRDVGPVLYVALALLGELKYPLVEEVPCVSAFAEALVDNEGFWRGLFGLLRRIHEGEALDSKERPSPRRLMLDALNVLLRAFAAVKSETTVRLLLTCARAGFFDAFDDIVEGFLNDETLDLVIVTGAP
ncbi:hypothetical protein EIP86_006813 [Pleurotus ostreatoroseus]|nr:hypothetical protein EIP86_006813 [Pleurotus ostreatoroseus]